MSKKYTLIWTILIIGLFTSFLFFHNAQSKVTETESTDYDDTIPASNVDTSYDYDQKDNPKGIPVLYYHSVRDSEDNELIISPQKLKDQLQFLKDEGYVSLSLKQVQKFISENSPIPPKSILITFDDGYMDNYYNAFPVLKELNMKAVIFCITSHLDGSYYLSENAIKEMIDYGIDIQSHTVNHDKLSSLSYEQQLNTLKKSKEYLENLTGKEIYSIAYPYGEFNDTTLKAAKDAGYSLGFITNSGLAQYNDNPLKLKRIYISSDYDLEQFKKIFFNTIDNTNN